MSPIFVNFKATKSSVFTPELYQFKATTGTIGGGGKAMDLKKFILKSNQNIFFSGFTPDMKISLIFEKWESLQGCL